MRKFDNDTIKILEKKNVKKAKIKKDKARFLKILGECQEFKNIYKEYHCSEFVLDDKNIEGLAFNCHELFYDKLIKELYCKNFGNCFEYKERKIAIRKYTYRVFTLDSLFLSDDNVDRVDLLSALDLCCNFFRKKDDIDSFYEEYIMFLNKVNNSRVCAWYSRSLEEVVELYCIYNHLTSKHYEYILEHCDIEESDIKGLLNYQKEHEKNVCREDFVKKLTETKTLEEELLGIVKNKSIKGFVEEMSSKIYANPYNFSQLRYKTLISEALKVLDKTIKINEERFNEESYFPKDKWCDEWCKFIKDTGIIEFETKNDFYRYLYCLTEDIVQPTGGKEGDKNLIERVTYNIAKKKNTLAGREKFSFETELIILRSLIIIKYYNEHDKDVFLEETNKKLKDLNLFQIYSVKNEILKGFAIDYAVTNDL